MIKVGVFDSGVGGLSIVNAIKDSFDDIEVMYQTDKENIPYGGKSPARLAEIAIPKIKSLEDRGCSVAVIACNTVTTNIIKEVRSALSIPVIAVEPMVKPAAIATKTKKITICATPATLASKRYKELKNMYTQDIEVFEPNCSDWTSMIENNTQNLMTIRSDIEESLKGGSDTVVLACTHYHWIEDDITKIADEYGAKVLQPIKPLLTQLRKVLEQQS